MNKNFTISSELESLKSKLLVKADDMGEVAKDDKEEELKSKFEALYNYITYLEKRMWENSSYANEWQYKHQEGHLPKLQAGGIEKLLKAAGEDQNYSVQKRVVFASDKNGVTALVDLTSK
jgi:hypothetical protein